MLRVVLAISVLCTLLLVSFSDNVQRDRSHSSPNGDRSVGVSILLLGDSLTQGFTHRGSAFHPYARKLEALLNETVPDNNPFPVPFLLHERGVSGETTVQIARRLQDIVRPKVHGHPRAFDMVCILGGTNDLGVFPQAPAAEIFARLAGMYAQVRRHLPRAIVVAMTVPQSGVQDQRYLARRSALNRLIREHSIEDASVLLVDLEEEIPYFVTKKDGSGRERDREIWDDTLHFTPKGYDRVGELVFGTIKDHAFELLEQAIQKFSGR